MGKEITLEHAERLREMLDDAREQEGTVDRVRRTAQEAKGVTTGVKRAVRGR
jgi:hypothetical protein